jgi:hypothetical protein
VSKLECPHRPFRLDEVESWPECLEILIEGELDLAASGVLRDALERALDSDHLYVIVDLDCCEWIDIVAVKLLVVAHAHHSSRGEEFPDLRREGRRASQDRGDPRLRRPGLALGHERSVRARASWISVRPLS